VLVRWQQWGLRGVPNREGGNGNSFWGFHCLAQHNPQPCPRAARCQTAGAGLSARR